MIKRYRSWDRREPHREWTALTLLAEHAPGLAPEPITADLDAAPPTVVMSRLPGVPLRGLRTGPAHVHAMAAALTRLHRAVPAASLPEPAAWTPAGAVAYARGWAAKRPDLGEDPRAAKAFAAGAAWLAGPDADRLAVNPFPPVLGQIDGNHANFLWDDDTAQVRILDWEDSGSSDRAFELAEVAEHISRMDGHLDGDGFLACLDLTVMEAARVRDFRRLLAFNWFVMLSPDGPFATRNPLGTFERQAERVLALLGAGR
ncbi:phosphotransferase family protein [Nonomuraea sp. NPDC049480]|uniref:phosphotransferase family protein n=1 Tax=Nonomuraea sp. NPDC049480 TaxID=3364353 RepID=UPI00379560E9